MSSYENVDDEDLDDPIKLVDSEQDRFFASSAKVIDVDETTWDLDDMLELLRPNDDNKSFAQQSNVSANQETFTLSDNFFQIAENIELLNMCQPFDIKIVDCSKHTYYYRNYIRSDVNNCNKSNESISKDMNAGEPKILKALKASFVEDNTKSVIKFNGEKHIKGPEIVCQVQPDKMRRESWLKTRRVNEENEMFHAMSKKNTSKVDLKKNVGLIGLKIEQTNNKDFFEESGRNCLLSNKITIGTYKKSDKVVNAIPTEVLNYSKQDNITKKTISECGPKEVTKNITKIDTNKINTDNLLIIQPESNLVETETTPKIIKNTSSYEKPKEVFNLDSIATTKHEHIPPQNISHIVTNEPMKTKKVTKRKSNLVQDKLTKKTHKTVAVVSNKNNDLKPASELNMNKQESVIKFQPGPGVVINTPQQMNSFLNSESSMFSKKISEKTEIDCVTSKPNIFASYMKSLPTKAKVKINPIKPKLKSSFEKATLNESSKTLQDANTKPMQNVFIQNTLPEYAKVNDQIPVQQLSHPKPSQANTANSSRHEILVDPRIRNQFSKQMRMPKQQCIINKADPKNIAKNVELPMNDLKSLPFVPNVTLLKGTSQPHTIQIKPNHPKSIATAEMKTKHIASIASQKSTNLLDPSQPLKINTMQSNFFKANNSLTASQNVQNIPLIGGALPSIGGTTKLIGGTQQSIGSTLPSIDGTLPLIGGTPQSIGSSIPSMGGAPQSVGSSIPSIGGTLPLYNGMPSSMAANQRLPYYTQLNAYASQTELSQPYQSYNNMPPICDVIPYSDYYAFPNYAQNMPVNVNGMNPEINMYPHYVDPSNFWPAGNYVEQHIPPTLGYYTPHFKNNKDTNTTNNDSSFDSIIGNNINGIVKKINILKKNPASKASDIQSAKQGVRKKRVTSKLPTVKKSPKFQKIRLDSSQNSASKGSNAKPSKKVPEVKDKSPVIRNTSITYSPPILPIPTYKNTLQFLGQINSNPSQDNVYVVSKDTLLSNVNNKDASYIQGNNKQPSHKTCNDIDALHKNGNNKHTKNKKGNIVISKEMIGIAKKISIAEYKNRLCIDLTGDDKTDEMDRRVSQAFVNRRSASQDLGYGSDTTSYYIK